MLFILFLNEACVHFHLNYNTDTTRAKEAAGDYAEDYLLSCLGAPDIGIDIAFPVIDILSLFGLDAIVEQVKEDLFNYLSEEATGMTVAELEQYLTSPERYFDVVMDGGIGEDVTLAEMNQILGLQDTGFPDFGQPIERYDYRDFPAAYNTVVMTKLLLMKPSEVNRLLDDLGSSIEFNAKKMQNPMLGFIRTLDGSYQWLPENKPWNPNPTKMILAEDEAAYQQIFMRVFPFQLLIAEESAMPNWENIDNMVIHEGETISKLISIRNFSRATPQIEIEGPSFVEFNDYDDGVSQLIMQPDYHHAGTYTLTFNITFPNGEAKQDVSLTVINVNRAPQIQPISPIFIEEGTESIIEITAFDPDGQEIKLSTTGLPPFASIKEMGGGLYELKLLPDYKHAGSYSPVITITDPEGASDEMVLNIEVINKLQKLPTEFEAESIMHPKKHKFGLIELHIINWQPNLSAQVQVLTDSGWANVVNNNNDLAWFDDTIPWNKVVRYAYGSNALGGEYRWVISDKTENHSQGWTVSEPFLIDHLGKRIMIQIQLPTK